jgi:alpha-glucoside transport system substrate-binding protein
MKFRFLAIPLVLALAFAACGDDKKKESGAVASSTTATTAAPITGTVNVLSAMDPAEATALQPIIDDKIGKQVGYKTTFEGNSDFESQVKIRVAGGNPPDVAMYPQVGAVIEQAKAGKALALEDLGFDVAQMKKDFGDYFMSLGEYNGKHYGVPTNINLKSMVWYPKKAFDAKGYTVPKTFDEMIALSNKIVADGSSPWCIGLESGSATGWTATDWMEDIMLRTAGPDVYDKWVKHQIPFNDPAVVHAGEVFGKILFPDKFVLGGAKNAPAIKFSDAPAPMFKNPPGCWLHRQANFINAFFPKTAVAGVDYDWFPFPSIDRPGDSALFGGELSVIFKDTPAVRDFMKRFAGTDVQCAQGGSAATSRISPNINVKSDCYANKLLAGASTVLTSSLAAGTGRFDASDLMPTAVGSGSFWTGMVKYFKNGAGSLAGVLSDIEKSWPKA